MRRKDIIQETEVHMDGFAIHLKPGFHNGDDPLLPEHSIWEDTKREAYARLKEVVPCACEGCKEARGQ